MENEYVTKEEDERAASAARDLAASTLDIWLARCAVIVIVTLQFLLVNDLTVVPRWVMPSLELALFLPLSIATAWSIGATKKVSSAESPSDFWEIVAHYRNMIRTAFLFLTGLVSIANLLSLAGLVQAILGGHAGSGKSLLVDALNIWATNLIIFGSVSLSVQPEGKGRREPPEIAWGSDIFSRGGRDVKPCCRTRMDYHTPSGSYGMAPTSLCTESETDPN